MTIRGHGPISAITLLVLDWAIKPKPLNPKPKFPEPG